jgi:drug/metabolite transporter (DMT)-like permease
MNISKNLLAHLSVIAANIIYGLNYTIAKEIMPDYLQPFALTLCRVVVASVLFWLLSFFYQTEKIDRKDIKTLIFAALFGVAVNQLMFLKGLNYTSPIDASIIMTVNPILVLLVSAVVVGEVINFRKISGIIIGATGAILLILMSGGQLDFSSDNFLGNLLVFLNALSYGIYLVIVKTLMMKYKPATVLKWVFSIGFLFIFPVGYEELSQTLWQSIPAYIWWAIAYVLIATTFLAYLLNVYGLQYVNASTVSIYIYSQPVIASFVSVVLGKDSLNVIKILATLLVFTGVYLVSVQKKEIRF